MFVDFLIIGFLLALTARLAWRRPRRFCEILDPTTALPLLDVPAFMNLLLVDDDIFLKDSLPPRYYRAAKRARTRAIQQYLLWVAKGCENAQWLLRQRPIESLGGTHEAAALSTLAFRLRVASLALWGCLWFQRLFPHLDLMPASLIRAYERFTDDLTKYFAAPRVPVGSEQAG